MRPIFKNKLSIYQATANIHAKILIGFIIHLIDQEIRKMLERGLYRTKISHFILVNDLLAIEIRIHF